MKNIKFKNCCQGCKNLIAISRDACDRDRNRYTIVECAHMPVCCKYKRANTDDMEFEPAESSLVLADVVENLLRELNTNAASNA